MTTTKKERVLLKSRQWFRETFGAYVNRETERLFDALEAAEARAESAEAEIAAVHDVLLDAIDAEEHSEREQAKAEARVRELEAEVERLRVKSDEACSVLADRDAARALLEEALRECKDPATDGNDIHAEPWIPSDLFDRIRAFLEGR